MARSYDELSIMAARFGFRLAKARRGSQHLGMPVRYLLEDKNGVTPFRSLEEVERKLIAMAQERAKRRTGSEVTYAIEPADPRSTGAPVALGAAVVTFSPAAGARARVGRRMKQNSRTIKALASGWSS